MFVKDIVDKFENCSKDDIVTSTLRSNNKKVDQVTNKGFVKNLVKFFEKNCLNNVFNKEFLLDCLIALPKNLKKNTEFNFIIEGSKEEKKMLAKKPRKKSKKTNAFNLISNVNNTELTNDFIAAESVELALMTGSNDELYVMTDIEIIEPNLDKSLVIDTYSMNPINPFYDVNPDDPVNNCKLNETTIEIETSYQNKIIENTSKNNTNNIIDIKNTEKCIPRINIDLVENNKLIHDSNVEFKTNPLLTDNNSLVSNLNNNIDNISLKRNLTPEPDKRPKSNLINNTNPIEQISTISNVGNDNNIININNSSTDTNIITPQLNNKNSVDEPNSICNINSNSGRKARASSIKAKEDNKMKYINLCSDKKVKKIYSKVKAKPKLNKNKINNQPVNKTKFDYLSEEADKNVHIVKMRKKNDDEIVGPEVEGDLVLKIKVSETFKKLKHLTRNNKKNKFTDEEKLRIEEIKQEIKIKTDELNLLKKGKKAKKYDGDKLGDDGSWSLYEIRELFNDYCLRMEMYEYEEIFNNPCIEDLDRHIMIMTECIKYEIQIYGEIECDHPFLEVKLRLISQRMSLSEKKIREMFRQWYLETDLLTKALYDIKELIAIMNLEKLLKR